MREIHLDPVGLKAAEEAMFRHMVDRERRKTDSFSFDFSKFEKAVEILDQCDNQTFIITSFSLISYCLNEAFHFHFRHVGRKDRDLLLEGLGPLSSDSSRLRLAKALGWLPKVLVLPIDRMRAERNRIAHGVVDSGSVNFDCLEEPVFSSRCSDLFAKWTDVLFDVNGKSVVPVYKASIRYVSLLSFDTLVSLIYGPGKLLIGISTNHVGALPGDRETRPPWEKDLLNKYLKLMYVQKR